MFPESTDNLADTVSEVIKTTRRMYAGDDGWKIVHALSVALGAVAAKMANSEEELAHIVEISEETLAASSSSLLGKLDDTKAN